MSITVSSRDEIGNAGHRVQALFNQHKVSNNAAVTTAITIAAERFDLWARQVCLFDFDQEGEATSFGDKTDSTILYYAAQLLMKLQDLLLHGSSAFIRFLRPLGCPSLVLHNEQALIKSLRYSRWPVH